MNRLRLGVNVDHVATLRQARRGAVPDVLAAALAAVAAGAEGITAHLREDRRHIQDSDIAALASRVRLNLEMAATPEMVAVASGLTGSAPPHTVCLVPERRQELTTEGGLDVVASVARLTDVVSSIQKVGPSVSLFIAADPWQVDAAARTGAKFIELHTGAYAAAFESDPDGEACTTTLRALHQAASTAVKLGLRVNAGHGLDTANVGRILDLEGLEELNIGFSIVARSVFIGMQAAVLEMKTAMAGTAPAAAGPGPDDVGRRA